MRFRPFDFDFDQSKTRTSAVEENAEILTKASTFHLSLVGIIILMLISLVISKKKIDKTK